MEDYWTKEIKETLARETARGAKLGNPNCYMKT
jgi:hypothetical protein